jgi:hypothetical protein
MNMKKQQGRKTWLHLGVFLLSVLATGGVLAGSVEMVAADTIGNVVDNAPDVSANNGGSYVPKLGSIDGANTPWNTYYIPSLGRERLASEGSFVKWGYDGWRASGDTDAQGNKTAASAYDPIHDMAIAPSNFGYTDTDWANGTIGTTTNIHFLKQVDGAPSHGKAFFSLNYVNKDNLMDVPDYQTAAQFAARDMTNRNNMFIQQENGQDSVQSKMSGTVNGTYPDGSNKYDYQLANGESFNNGYIQVTGNVPIEAQLAQSETTIDGMLAGNWGVMVRAKVAPGIDVRSFAASIDWDKSYYNLSIDSTDVTFTILGINISRQIPSLTFPLQFDRHVYLDPNDSRAFYLKVKGIPFNFQQWSDLQHTQMYLPKSKSDYTDYLHNRVITDGDAGSQKALTLDKLTTGQGNTDYDASDYQGTLNDSDLTTDGTKPNFPISEKTKDVNPRVWDPFAGLLDEMLKDVESLTLVGGIVKAMINFFGVSPIYDLGAIGRTVTLLNAPLYPNDREPTDFNGLAGIINFPRIIANPIYESLSSRYLQNPFYGNAHINFSFDMSKYQGNKQPLISALSNGKLFASPYADGGFNKGTGDDTSATSLDKTNANRSPIQISMYDSSQLVDPYATTWGLSRGRYKVGTDSTVRGEAVARATGFDSQGNVVYIQDPLLKQLRAGTSPMDYAVIDNKQINNGTAYPTYTNFNSWTGAIVPYDRDYWDTHKSTTDTVHSDGKIGDDLNYRTATPDAGSDGVLVNPGIKNQPVVDPYVNPDPPTKNKAGSIDPMRYANVYTLYDYSQSKPTVWTDGPREVYDKDANGDQVNVSVADGVNVDAQKKVTKSLQNDQWDYTGTLNGLPLADATLGLNQSLLPTLNIDPETLLVQREKLDEGQELDLPAGTYRDPLAAYATDGFWTQLSAKNTDQSVKAIPPVQPFKISPATHGFNVNLLNYKKRTHIADPANNAYFDMSTGGTATFKYQMPVDPSTPGNNNFWYHNMKFARLQDVTTGSGYVVPGYAAGKQDSNVDWRAPASYTDGMESYVNNQGFILLTGKQLDNTYSVQKSFSDGTTTHILTGGQETVGVKTTATLNQGKSPVSTVVIRMPKVAGTTLTNIQIPGAASTKQVDNDAGTWLDNNFVSYQATFTSAPSTINWTYDYQIASAADSGKVPLDVGYLDLLMDSTDQSLGESNTVDFNIYRNPSIDHAPSLDFDKHSLPKTATDTAATTYQLAKGAVDDAYFTVRDDHANTQEQSSWRLLASMSPFMNGTDSHENWFVSWNEPYAKLTDGSYQKEVKPGDYVPPTTASDPKDEWWAYYNHQPQDLIADYAMSQMYFLDRLHEKDVDVHNGLSRYYPDATLTLPANSANPVSGKYTATIRYTLGSKSDGI